MFPTNWIWTYESNICSIHSKQIYKYQAKKSIHYFFVSFVTKMFSSTISILESRKGIKVKTIVGFEFHYYIHSICSTAYFFIFIQ